MQVGDLQDSSVYIRMKSKAAAEVGITVKHLKLSSQVC
jgi:5,10-methylene-tetrahydrofolate dehydrogenase/methenyl tetrahydrofolate cyclohydrolase